MEITASSILSSILLSNYFAGTVSSGILQSDVELSPLSQIRKILETNKFEWIIRKNVEWALQKILPKILFENVQVSAYI